MTTASPLNFAWHGVQGAPIVVLLHSIATNNSLWALQLPMWARHFRILAVDLPGHGGSPRASAPSIEAYADSVADCLSVLDVSRAGVVGLSLGGMVAQAFALRHPERVVALVITHSAARTPEMVASLWSERIALASAQGMVPLVQPTLDRWFTPEFAAASPLHIEWIANLIARTDLGGFCDAAAAIRKLDLLDQLPGLDVPALVVAGERDTALPVSIAVEIAARIPAARLETIASAHLGNVEQPVAFAEIVGGFLTDCL